MLCSLQSRQNKPTRSLEWPLWTPVPEVQLVAHAVHVAWAIVWCALRCWFLLAVETV